MISLAVRRVIDLSLVVGLATSAYAFYPVSRIALEFAMRPDDPVAAARLKLERLDRTDYEDQAKAALSESDAELASGIASLAVERGFPFKPSLLAEINKAGEFDALRTAKDVWGGAFSRKTDTPAGFAGSLVADLSVAGDIRDLLAQAGNYPDHDDLTVVLAATGIAVTGATMLSGMGALPAKAGVSLLKTARKTGKLREPLQRELRQIASGAVDMDAARDVALEARRLDAYAVLSAARRIVRPAAVTGVRTAAENLGSIAGKQGYRGTMQTIALADSTDEINRMRRLSDRFGEGYRATLRLTGKAGVAVLRVGEILLLVGGYLLGVAVWGLSASFLAIRTMRSFARLGRSVGRRVLS